MMCTLATNRLRGGFFVMAHRALPLAPRAPAIRFPLRHILSDPDGRDAEDPERKERHSSASMRRRRHVVKDRQLRGDAVHGLSSTGVKEVQPDHRLSYPGEFHEAYREDPDGHRSGMCRSRSGTGRSAFAPCVSFRSPPPSRVPLGAVTATFPGTPGMQASFRQIRRGL